jgi:hypothetical protein
MLNWIVNKHVGTWIRAAAKKIKSTGLASSSKLTEIAVIGP